MGTKTHFRKVFKSDHLGSADLEEYIEEKKPLIFTIDKVKQEYNTKVAGRKIDANIAYFKNKNVKPLVLNATNSNILKRMSNSAFVEDWSGLTIELYIDKSVKMKGEVVGGVRIKQEPPKLLTPKEAEVIRGKIIASTSKEQLTEIWNSNKSIKLDADLSKEIKDKAIQLSK